MAGCSGSPSHSACSRARSWGARRGGAILTIPVLIYVVGMPPHDATTASLVIIGVSAAATAISHIRGGTARVPEAVILAAVGTIGTYAGSLASAAVAAPVLVVLLASLLAVVGALMLRQSSAVIEDWQSHRWGGRGSPTG
ncbi:MAG: sulfite exporter TauE/SafE family protein [Actinomycetales bacterium]|uniref:Probable membrane transporter protein n=1 Tax=Candidatus Phosphoribacter hodrii TaxID=2953743 RepID=A0A9D7T9G0_9MICO|nr:sulfite exporter TauE/SafE family protein [Candidatus Phosphoribacter hodrii]